MVPFFLTIESDNQALTITVEQLQNFADVDGYCRYAITAGERRSVIYVNIEQALVYTETDDDLFTTWELNSIAAAICQHNRQAGISFPEFNFDL